jgi:hypothetical protein
MALLYETHMRPIVTCPPYENRGCGFHAKTALQFLFWYAGVIQGIIRFFENTAGWVDRRLFLLPRYDTLNTDHTTNVLGNHGIEGVSLTSLMDVMKGTDQRIRNQKSLFRRSGNEKNESRGKTRGLCR